MFRLSKYHPFGKVNKSHTKKMLTICFLALLIVILSFNLNFAQTSVNGLMFAPPSMCSIMLKWDPNTEADLAHYIVKVGKTPDDFFSEHTTTDTAVQIFLPDSMKQDSILCSVYAVNAEGKVSNPSQEIFCIPRVVNVDFSRDEAEQINRADIDSVLALYHKYYYKEVWWYSIKRD